MSLLQVGERTASFPESVRAAREVSLLTKGFRLFCLCLSNLGILKLRVIEQHFLLVRLNGLLKLFAFGLVRDGY